MEFSGSAEDLARTTAAHPTLQRSHPRSRADVRRRGDPHLVTVGSLPPLREAQGRGGGRRLHRSTGSTFSRLDLAPLRRLACAANSHTPSSTSAVPAACQMVNVSPNTVIASADRHHRRDIADDRGTLGPDRARWLAEMQ